MTNPSDPNRSDSLTFHVSRRVLFIVGIAVLVVAVGIGAYFLGSSTTGQQARSAHKMGVHKERLAKSPVVSSIPTTLPSTTTTTGAPTTTTTAVPTTIAAPPSVLACADNAPLSDPGTIILACASGNTLVQGIDWSSWTATSATGSGTYVTGSCDINCPQGSSTSYAASVTLSNPGQTQYGLIFQTLTVNENGQTQTYSLPGST